MLTVHRIQHLCKSMHESNAWKLPSKSYPQGLWAIPDYWAIIYELPKTPQLRDGYQRCSVYGRWHQALYYPMTSGKDPGPLLAPAFSTRHSRGAHAYCSHLLSARGLSAEESYPMQALFAARQLHLPQRAVQHCVFHFAGLSHSAKFLERSNF